VEHIIPRSASLDDSFANLTLALASENAVKSNRTPMEAYGKDEARWAAILDRVKAFKGEYAKRKLDRFRTEKAEKEELLAQFSARHLNDTRYASVLAARYLALLFGGEVAGGKRKVLKTTGQITADLRNAWDLNRILGDGPRKSRDDHRHHAVDAAVVAVVSQKWIGVLSDAAERAAAERKRRYASIAPPWVCYKEDLAAAVVDLNVSIRPDHRVSGAIHKETYYSKVGETGTGGGIVRTRKPVHQLTGAEVRLIADVGVRAAVMTKLAEKAVGGDPAKLENNWPELQNRNGGPAVKIKKVRIELNRTVQSVGSGHRRRWAEGGETHHVEVFELSKGRKKAWNGVVVPMREALERVGSGKPVVDRGEADGQGFLFSLSKGDAIELGGERKGIWVVKKIKMNGQITIVRQWDARVEGKRDEFSPTIGGLQKFCARKVLVTPLGEVLPCRE
jgi:CRISPR-associated endonuclease Csn1